ncbi:hypothetical protein [Leptospira santarosai]|uniref:Uncharacterized protein n=1 Tax=Leptospira santarosai serovar Arenal str. MAVJ 401 TaxID=1049976 RepID=M6JMZ8_9LEPT|nr:hypothetical protein [Leptospira santarosai]EMN20960.1 hypothetical protein LEP1GSC063_3808 [Leptospira santarosai serovar Arenal str. MAVJ 401]
MSLTKRIKEDLWIDHCERAIRFKGELKQWKDCPQHLKTERMKNYYFELKGRFKTMNLPTYTIERYKAVSALLYEIRYAIFFDKISQEDKRYLENYKVPLEHERSALFKAIETDQKFLTTSEFCEG